MRTTLNLQTAMRCSTRHPHGSTRNWPRAAAVESRNRRLPRQGRDANAILARPEFRIVSGESWLDRKVAQFWDWVNRFFSAAADIGHRAPWLGPVLEWSFVGLVVLFLLIWAARTLQRERLAISLSSMIPASHWQKEADNWAELARLEAEKSNWREAIHCLYWASIVALESHRLWRRDNARTPREYVELLEPQLAAADYAAVDHPHLRADMVRPEGCRARGLCAGAGAL
jgi:hypothetical protein